MIRIRFFGPRELNQRTFSGEQCKSCTSLASDIGFVWNSLAKQAAWRCFISSRRDILQIHGSSRSSVMWVVISKNFGALCVHVPCWWTVFRVVCSSTHHGCLRACDQSLMRVLLRVGGDDEEPPLVLVGIVVSRLYMSFLRLGSRPCWRRLFPHVVCRR